MRSSLSETPAASQSAFIIGQLYSTSVFVDINKLYYNIFKPDGVGINRNRGKPLKMQKLEPVWGG